ITDVVLSHMFTRQFRRPSSLPSVFSRPDSANFGPPQCSITKPLGINTYKYFDQTRPESTLTKNSGVGGLSSKKKRFPKTSALCAQPVPTAPLRTPIPAY